MTAEEEKILEQLENEDEEIFNWNDYTEEERERIKETLKAAQKAAAEYLNSTIDFSSYKETFQYIVQTIISNLAYQINPDKIPAELLENEEVQTLAEQLRSGNIEKVKETISHMPLEMLLKLRQAIEESAPAEKREITKYKNVPIEVLSDLVTYQIFIRQIPSGNYIKEFKRGNKVIATLDFDLELSKTADKLGVYEKVIVQSIYTLMKQTGNKTIDGSKLYKIMTNDPDAKLTPRTIENIIRSIDLLTTAKIKCARVNIFDNPETPSMDVYRQIFKYDYMTIIRKADETPKNFQIVMSELPLTAIFAEQLHQISERPFGFYQLPAGKRATKKNTSLIHELLRLVIAEIKDPQLKPPNLDELMERCGFDITDRDETKKARDLITAILKGREDTKKNRENHPEIVIENYSGFEWKIDKRTGKRTNIEIKSTGIKGDATPKNTGIKGDAVSKNTGIKGDATRPCRNAKKPHK